MRLPLAHTLCELTTFTFTLICHPGKTHNHRSRGDTTWRAQCAAHTVTLSQRHKHAAHKHRHQIEQTQKRGGGSVKVVKETAQDARRGPISRSTLGSTRTFARANV